MEQTQDARIESTVSTVRQLQHLACNPDDVRELGLTAEEIDEAVQAGRLRWTARGGLEAIPNDLLAKPAFIYTSANGKGLANSVFIYYSHHHWTCEGTYDTPAAANREALALARKLWDRVVTTQKDDGSVRIDPDPPVPVNEYR